MHLLLRRSTRSRNLKAIVPQLTIRHHKQQKPPQQPQVDFRKQISMKLEAVLLPSYHTFKKEQ